MPGNGAPASRIRAQPGLLDEDRLDRATMESEPPRRRSGNEELLSEIVAFCRRVGMAESTFGRRAVNDGKFVSRLRVGGRVTTQTVDRVRAFMRGTLAGAPREGSRALDRLPAAAPSVVGESN